MPSDSTALIPDGLTLDDILTRDLTHDPPSGMPKLTPLQFRYVTRRARYPTESIENSLRAIGATPRSPIRNAAKVKLYMNVVNALSMPDDEDPSDLRRAAVSRLGRVVRRGDDREATMAAKVLQDYLPKQRPDQAPELAELSDQAVLERLRTVLEACDAQSQAVEVALKRGEDGVYTLSPVPTEGTGPPPGGGGAEDELEQPLAGKYATLEGAERGAGVDEDAASANPKTPEESLP